MGISLATFSTLRLMCGGHGVIDEAFACALDLPDKSGCSTRGSKLKR